MTVPSSIVSVSISANSTTVSREGFGVPLCLSYHTRFTDRYRAYSSTAEMVSDGFTTYDDAYRMAAACFAQDPAPDQVIVGRLPSAPSYVTKLTVTAAYTAGEHVKFKVIQPATGTVTSIDYTILGSEGSIDAVATAIELLTEAITGVDSTVATNVVSLVPTVAGRRVHVYDLTGCTIEESTADAGYDTELAALQLENDDWYAITCDSASAANVADVAAWALTNKKLYFFASPNSALLAGTALGLDLSTNDRVVPMYAANSHEFLDCRYASVGLVEDPGSITWKFKTLLGGTTKTLTSTQQNFLEADDYNHYQTIAGVAIMQQGTVGTGEFIDIRHGTDALEAAIKEDVLALFANSKKVPFTKKGLALVANAIKGAMKRFEGDVDNPGLLVPSSSVVIMPAVEDIPLADRQARRLTGVRFSATYSGAIHAAEFTGTLSV